MTFNTPSRSLFADQLVAPFRSLDLQRPHEWPAAPRAMLLLLMCVTVIALLWWFWLSSLCDELTTERAQEAQLRAAFQIKLAKAINLEVLKRQREGVLAQVRELERQLPTKAEMDALLSDINQAGLGRSLQFELFRPGAVTTRSYYAEQPIALRVSGRYHDMGAFASDLAHLSRIVILGNLTLVPGRDGLLTLDATARTFRYLDDDERAAQRPAPGNQGVRK